ncbi:glycoside hydrolase family 10 protein [Xylariomycetidae sp. FL2044]|nr:glycoside hydrolase family 10 protein [Xylariomycetidae sp. FL2044]
MKITSIVPLLAAPCAALAHPITSSSSSSPRTRHSNLVRRQASESIHELFKQKGNGNLYFGATTDAAKMTDEETAILEKDFGQITAEYSMKWAATEPSQDQFQWDDADTLVDFAQSHGKVVRGHTLIWAREDLGDDDPLPDWVASITDRDQLRSVMENHIKTVVGRYRGKVRSWDVVNEIFDDSDDTGFRSSVFYDVLGEDFVGIAFRAARDADPDAKLYINDYNLDNASWAKVKFMVDKVKGWKAQGIPIDGIGSQSHLKSGMSDAVHDALAQLATAADEVALTELDITDFASEDYWKVVQACDQVKKCVGITVWGVSDKDSWLADQKPLLFDSDYQAKDVYWAIVDYLKGKFGN